MIYKMAQNHYPRDHKPTHSASALHPLLSYTWLYHTLCYFKDPIRATLRMRCSAASEHPQSCALLTFFPRFFSFHILHSHLHLVFTTSFPFTLPFFSRSCLTLSNKCLPTQHHHHEAAVCSLFISSSFMHSFVHHQQHPRGHHYYTN